MRRDALGRFTGNKYRRDEKGRWLKVRCKDCRKWIPGLRSKQCKECWQESIKGDKSRLPTHSQPHSQKTKDVISQKKRGESLSYSGLHQWVRKHFGDPTVCEHCGTLEAKNYEWANISRKYLEDLADWVRLCKSCHTNYDARRLTCV